MKIPDAFYRAFNMEPPTDEPDPIPEPAETIRLFNVLVYVRYEHEHPGSPKQKQVRVVQVGYATNDPETDLSDLPGFLGGYLILEHLNGRTLADLEKMDSRLALTSPDMVFQFDEDDLMSLDDPDDLHFWTIRGTGVCTGCGEDVRTLVQVVAIPFEATIPEVSDDPNASFDC